MNILYLANIRLPTEKAHGLQIMKTCEALAREGHAVELVVPTRHNALSDDPFAYYGVEKIFKLTTLRVPDFIRFGRFGFLVSLLWFSEAARLRRQFWRADVIYSRDALVLLQYVLLGRRLVFESHTKPSAIVRFVARRAHRVIVIAKALGEIYEAAGVRAERIRLVPDAVDLSVFDRTETREECRTQLGLSQDKRIVAYVGKLHTMGESKGVENLIQAMGLFVGAHPDAHLLLVGLNANEFSVAEALAARAQLPEAARTFVGHVSYAEVARYLRAADVLVMSYPNTEHYARYMSPMKLFEYMASGTPIVTTDLPTIREVLDDTTALFTRDTSTRALEEGVVAVLSDPASAATRAQEARRRVTEYSWAKRASRIAAALQSA